MSSASHQSISLWRILNVKYLFWFLSIAQNWKERKKLSKSKVFFGTNWIQNQIGWWYGENISLEIRVKILFIIIFVACCFNLGFTSDSRWWFWHFNDLKFEKPSSSRRIQTLNKYYLGQCIFCEALSKFRYSEKAAKILRIFHI